MCPLNYQVIVEGTGVDLRIGLKPCYPIVKGVEEIHRQKVLEIFEEDSDYVIIMI